MSFCPKNLDSLSEILGRTWPISELFCPNFSDILNLPYPPSKNRPSTETVISNEDGCGHSSKQSKLEANHGSIV